MLFRWLFIFAPPFISARHKIISRCSFNIDDAFAAAGGNMPVTALKRAENMMVVARSRPPLASSPACRRSSPAELSGKRLLLPRRAGMAPVDARIFDD